MEGKCDWCKKESSKLTKFQVLDTDYSICTDCVQDSEEDICINCKEPLYGEMAINGECSGCQQVKAAALEKRKSEIMNGLGVDVLAELTHSVVFTEEDYEKWVTFSQGTFTPESRKILRRDWIRHKLVNICGWEEETFDANVADIELLLDGYSHKIFNQNCTFVVVDKNGKGLRGLNIIARQGNVIVIDMTEDNEIA